MMWNSIWNGVPVGREMENVHAYTTVPVVSAARATLHIGENILAVHVRHSGSGRRFADAALVEMK
jgi:hypothetical protein